MPPTLKISIEHSWRGSILDTVGPIAEFALADDESNQGMKSLGKEHDIQLTSGEMVSVWCALTPQQQFRFSLSKGRTTLVSLTTEGPFFVEVRLPDGKLYEFELKHDC
jgi:hypothetical protein